MQVLLLSNVPEAVVVSVLDGVVAVVFMNATCAVATNVVVAVVGLLLWMLLLL